MKRFLQLISLLSVIACSGNKQVDVTGISPSPFIGKWEIASSNDSVQNLSLHIGERNDSLLVAFYWERQEPFYMTGNPLSDSNGNAIPQACISVPKSGNKAVGNIVNQYFAVFQNYPKNEYYPIAFELKSFDTLTFKISGNVNYWPDSAALVRKSNDNYTFSTEVIDLYRENYLVPDADVSGVNEFDVTGMEPSPFIGSWGWDKNGSWQNFSVEIAAKGDSLLLAAGGVFLGGARIQMPEYDENGNAVAQARLLAPKRGNKAVGRFFMDADCAVTLELFSNKTLLFKTEAPIGFWPDSAVMVRTDGPQLIRDYP